MIEIEIPKDIRKYESKFIGPFTLRQTICVGIAAACSITIYNTVGKLLIQDMRAPLCFIAAAPALLAGWYKPYGLPLEKFLKVIIVTMILAPTKRLYKTANIYDCLTQDEKALMNKETKRRKAAALKYRKKMGLKPEFRAYK